MSDVISEGKMEAMKESLARHGQEHVLTWWEELDNAGKEQLVKDLSDVDLEEMTDMYQKTCGDDVGPGRDMSSMEPVDPSLCESIVSSSPAQLSLYRDAALLAAGAGQVGVLLLAGGQGTRLGVPYPKGMYDIGLPSGKTLYQIQVERVLRLQELAKRLTGQVGQIPMYVMTSEHTKQPTLEFFKKHDYFGMNEDQLNIFEQRTIPAFDMQGRFIMETKSKLARSPDGNGGLYWALKNQGVLEDLEKRDVRYLHVYCVDNVLVRVADPVFMGYCIYNHAEAGNKVVEKSYPEEAVGVVCKLEGKIQVVEYSEISKETSELRSSDGRLTYCAGNICNHFFTTDFLKRVCDKHERELPHHIAKKKIPFTDLASGQACKPGTPNGIKLEKFVFDVFQFSNSFVVWECIREDEFSPLKNADTAAKDTPTTSRQSLYMQHRRFLETAGATVEGADKDAVEISPLVTFAGEGLEEYAGKLLKTPITIGHCAAQMNGH
eukprot:GFUD01002196.1.p1 GENE.GFUD01002196.1~~GFUD01002196.1.p1  ORF type:complete len:491 (+),score=139.43 GFUD01002196.1:105-1577(+)